MRVSPWLAAAAAAVLSLPMIPLPGPGPAPTRPTPPPTLPAITVLSVGDSLTVGVDGSASASYRAELSRLMLLTGQPHTWVVAARGGSKCSEWASKLDALITLHNPDLIFLNCGTNDTPDDSTEADYRSMLATVQARGKQVVASLIGRPNMEARPTNTDRPWIDDWMDATNDAIRRALAAYPSVPYASMYRVPANPEWLQWDGIHLLGRAEAAWGQLFYQAAAPMRGWRTLAQMRMAEMCGLSGHDRDDPWPAVDVDYRPCRN